MLEKLMDARGLKADFLKRTLHGGQALKGGPPGPSCARGQLLYLNPLRRSPDQEISQALQQLSQSVMPALPFPDGQRIADGFARSLSHFELSFKPALLHTLIIPRRRQNHVQLRPCDMKIL